MQERNEVIGEEWIKLNSTTPPFSSKPLVYDIPLVYDHSEKKVDNVRTLKTLIKCCLEIMKDESSLSMMHGMIDPSSQDK
jgi:hypothetical protein